MTGNVQYSLVNFPTDLSSNRSPIILGLSIKAARIAPLPRKLITRARKLKLTSLKTLKNDLKKCKYDIKMTKNIFKK